MSNSTNYLSTIQAEIEDALPTAERILIEHVCVKRDDLDTFLTVKNSPQFINDLRTRLQKRLKGIGVELERMEIIETDYYTVLKPSGRKHRRAKYLLNPAVRELLVRGEKQ